MTRADARVICPKNDDCALNSGATHCKHCGRNWPPDETWQPRHVRELITKMGRLRRDYEMLARWADEQGAGNDFAVQLGHYARARLDEWNLPVEEWEP